MQQNTQAFIDALAGLEKTGDAEPIAKLFASDADVSNPMVKHDSEGEDGARAFWHSYRTAFDEIKSQFRHVIEDGDVAMLEWTSEGKAAGKPVRYGGVSVLEHGAEGIVAFRTYFNPLNV